MTAWTRTRWTRNDCLASAPGGGGPAPGVLTVELVPLVPQILEVGAPLTNPMFNLLEAGGGGLTFRELQDDDGNAPQDELGSPNPVTRLFVYNKTTPLAQPKAWALYRTTPRPRRRRQPRRPPRQNAQEAPGRPPS